MSGPICTHTPMLLWLELVCVAATLQLACVAATLQLACVAATLQLVVMFLHHMCSIPSFIVKTVMNFNVSVECFLSLFWFIEGKQVKFETLVVTLLLYWQMV